MAIAIDSRQTGTSSAAATTLSWSHTLGASLSNAILTVQSANAANPNRAITGINWDDGGSPVALTRKGRIQDSTTFAWVEIWYLLSPAVSGTKTIKVTYAGSMAGCTGSSSWSGVDQTTIFNAASPQTATGADPTQPSVTVTSAAGERVIDCVADNENFTDTLVIGGGQTSIHNITVGAAMAGASSDEAGAASVVMSWTGVTSTATWATIGVSMVPAAGTGASPGFGTMWFPGAGASGGPSILALPTGLGPPNKA